MKTGTVVTLVVLVAAVAGVTAWMLRSTPAKNCLAYLIARAEIPPDAYPVDERVEKEPFGYNQEVPGILHVTFQSITDRGTVKCGLDARGRFDETVTYHIGVKDLLRSVP